jgi:hypothetical protein
MTIKIESVPVWRLPARSSELNTQQFNTSRDRQEYGQIAGDHEEKPAPLAKEFHFKA